VRLVSPRPNVAMLRVVIVEDDETTRHALRALISATGDYQCVGAYASVEDALASPSRPVDVVLLDIHLPGITGVQGVRPLTAHWPNAQILMLTVFPDDDKVFASICDGAVGYLLKKTPSHELLAAIRDAAGGGAPMSPEIARKVVALVRQHRAAPPKPATELAPQELRLLQLLADGYGYESAGRQMSITVNTVRTYIRSVYEKLHVKTKSEAVSRALRDGLIR
jgi:DNA-binding NarL/FixJ family response regulator